MMEGLLAKPADNAMMRTNAIVTPAAAMPSVMHAERKGQGKG